MSKIKQIQIGEDTFDLGVNASDIDGQVGGTLPQGGTQGQVLIKNSGTDYDTVWSNMPTPDLSNYYTKSQTDSAIASAITTALNGSY